MPVPLHPLSRKIAGREQIKPCGTGAHEKEFFERITYKTEK